MAEVAGKPGLDAGEFGAWLDELRGALRGGTNSSVPCDGCTACCTAAQFVHVEPDESDTLAHIPAALLFPAPNAPDGHMLMGYDARGACPMFVDDRCSIYEHRPRACRVYDCRVFAAAGVDPADDGEAKQGVAERVRRWRFSYATPRERELHDAVRDAAGAAATTATERALRALASVTDSDRT